MLIINYLISHLVLLIVLQSRVDRVVEGRSNNGIFRDMETLTERLGKTLFKISNSVTKFTEFRDRFSSNPLSSIETVDVEQLFSEVISKVNASLQRRVEAIQKITNYAEPRACDHYSNFNSKDKSTVPKSYYNAKLLNQPPPISKKINLENGEEEEDDDEDEEEKRCSKIMSTELKLEPNPHFRAEVNMSLTSVHVPTSIYHCEPPLVEALAWSSDLEDTFKTNYEENPTLSWQYFGSSTGFLRIYPAIKWSKDNRDLKAPDLYDSRFRPWYTASATSPKNLIILQDVSGSMTGMRSKISRAVVNSILDTLTENDYINVFNVSDETISLVECFNDTGVPTLVQATLANILEFRIALEQRKASGMANFTEALNKAFETLKLNMGESESANCNQAIMLVTDGAPYYFQELFDEWNRDKKIRLFTYLVGREVTDTNEVQWMACYNQGYFVHVSTLSEVQEQVIKYIPVMSRPLVMSQKREVMWSPVYSDMSEIIESEWKWEEKTRVMQRVRSERYKWFLNNVVQNNKKKGANKTGIIEFSDGRKRDEKSETLVLALPKVRNFLDYNKTTISYRDIRKKQAEEERIKSIQDSTDNIGSRPLMITSNNILNSKFLSRSKDYQHIYSEHDAKYKPYNFVVSASFPVYDIRNYTNSSGQEERIANFLGVVGTDVSIDELKHLTMPFQLGVNAYAFAITNNGHVVFHPDFRPLYEEDILKPSYNSIDFSEIELMDKDGLFRNNDSDLLVMRREMINKVGPEPSSKYVLRVRIHRDKFRRVSVRDQVYVFGKIPKTLYTLGIQVPLNSTVYKGEIELSRLWPDSNVFAISYFEPHTNSSERRWKIHPDWTYCSYLSYNDTLKHTQNKEDLLIYFIKMIQNRRDFNSTWAWGSVDKGVGNANDYYICNRELFQSIVFDANITKPFENMERVLQEPRTRSLFINNQTEALKKGLLTTFITTRSGLNRWAHHNVPLDDPDENFKNPPPQDAFNKYYPRSIDESWYVRAVERAEFDEESYVYSVDFDAGTRVDSRVTATRGIMASNFRRRDKKAPVGVIGAQYDLDRFLTFFGIGPDADFDEKNICQSESFDCFLLDDSGFVIGSEIRDDTGRFFGEIDGTLMYTLLNASLYKMVTVVDYQAICFHPAGRINLGNILETPLAHLTMLLNWFLISTSSLLLQLNLNIPFLSSFASQEYLDDDEDDDAPEADGSMPFIDFATVGKTKLRPCEKEYNLFTYGPTYSLDRRTLLHRSNVNMCDQKCEDYLSVQKVPHSNLVLVIVESKCRCGRMRMSVDGREVIHPLYHKFINRTEQNPLLEELCRTPYSPLYRKRLTHCHFYDKDEFIMKEDCGRASLASFSLILLIFSMAINIFR